MSHGRERMRAFRRPVALGKQNMRIRRKRNPPHAPVFGWSALLIGMFAFAIPPTAAQETEAETSKSAPEDPDAPAPAFVLVEGQITAGAGGGVDGAKVVAHRAAPDGSKGEPVAETATDKLGDFKVALTNPESGKFFVVVTRDGYEELSVTVERVESKSPPFVGQSLSGGGKLTGRVVDALTSAPVAGARIRVDETFPERSARSEDDGRFTLTGLEPGEVRLVVEASGYGRERRKLVDPTAAGDLLTVELRPERVVTLIVVDDVGKPVAGVTIEALDARRSDFHTAISDAEGKARLGGLPFDSSALGVRLTHGEHVSDAMYSRKLDLPSDVASSTHTLTMTRAGRIEGRVFDALGKPAHAARVTVGDEESDDSPRAFVDVDGRFALGGIAPGQAAVVVYLRGAAPELLLIDIRPGETSRLEATLKTGRVVAGVVKLTGGAAPRSAMVEMGTWRGRQAVRLRARTDDDGRFEIADMPLDGFELIADAAGAKPGKVNVPDATAGNSPLEIELATNGGGPPGRPATLAEGESAPELTLTTLAGGSVNLADMTGKFVVVEFWATWCAPCVAELPHLIAVYEKHGRRSDFAMIGVSLDFEADALQQFLKSNPRVAWPQVLESAGDGPATKAFGVGPIPRVFIIGPDRKIMAANLRGDELVKRVDELLKGDKR